MIHGVYHDKSAKSTVRGENHIYMIFTSHSSFIMVHRSFIMVHSFIMCVMTSSSLSVDTYTELLYDLVERPSSMFLTTKSVSLHKVLCFPVWHYKM